MDTTRRGLLIGGAALTPALAPAMAAADPAPAPAIRAHLGVTENPYGPSPAARRAALAWVLVERSQLRRHRRALAEAAGQRVLDGDAQQPAVQARRSMLKPSGPLRVAPSGEVHITLGQDPPAGTAVAESLTVMCVTDYLI